ncbi:unnamed protein product [Echinostoma caproni]|uniref:RING-CH-type domain-containing protein n=1 Tax=Echinostoma caproni TaxID=27848 RepID=A0A183A752_9TREM|nr:unnamed protein product [Echinostoma caproni]
MSSTSPHRKTVLSNPNFTRVPNAPRPSLELNDENVLFSSRRLLEKHTKRWKLAVNLSQNSGLLNSSALHFTPAEHAAVTNPIRASFINVHRTSTPHLRHSFRQTSSEDVLNSALIGAPRLALNQSLSSSVEESGTTGNLNQTDYAGVATSSFEEEQQSQRPDRIPSLVSPPVRPRQIICTEATKKQQLEISQLSTASNGPFRCRICLEEGDPERVLLSPCRCKGTVGLVHRHCLQRWILESGKPSCELCGYAYIMTPSRRRSAPMFSQRVARRFGSFREWINLATTRKHLMTDLICLTLLTPSTYLGVYFCLMGAMSYAKESVLSWQVIGLGTLALLLVFLLTLWVILAVRHHWNNYQRYRYYQRRRTAEETERMAALPRWRFSIQPRPRGSSIYLHSLTDQTARLGDSVSCTNNSELTRDASSSGQFSTSVSSEMEIQTQFVPGLQSRQRLHSTSQQIVVSVALSAVPEVTEEYSTPSANQGSEDLV